MLTQQEIDEWEYEDYIFDTHRKGRGTEITELPKVGMTLKELELLEKKAKED